MSRLFCTGGINQAIDDLLEAVLSVLPDSNGMSDRIHEAISGAVERIVPRAEEAVESYSERAHEECYSWEMVQEEVESAIKNLDRESLPEELAEEVKEEGRVESLPDCPDCGTGSLVFNATLAVLKCDRCWTERPIKS